MESANDPFSHRGCYMPRGTEGFRFHKRRISGHSFRELKELMKKVEIYDPNFARESAYGQSVDVPIFVRKDGDRQFFLYQSG
jgi:hypothetical protein